MRLEYPIEIEPDGAALMVTIPDWDNAVTCGDDLAEALDNARDCVEELVADRINRREGFPAPSPARGRRLVSPESRLAFKAAIWAAMREQGITFEELARRLSLASAEKAEQLVDPRRRTRQDLLDAAAAALGKRVALELQDAA